MNKVIAVIDKPESCFNCPFFLHGFHIKCKLSNKNMDYIKPKDSLPEWCELKPVPEKILNRLYISDKVEGAYHGWNSCIDEILGEKL